MDIEQKLELLFGLQIVSFAIISTAIIGMEPGDASNIYLYEVFGALVASILTVFGIREMRGLTS